MSGGHWNYSTDRAAEEVFNYRIYPDYGEDGFSLSKEARKINPLEDKEMSELVWDVFCVMHSYDWYRSGDNSEIQYRADVKTFKDKWLAGDRKDRIKEIIDGTFNDAKEELYVTFGIKESDDAENDR